MKQFARVFCLFLLLTSAALCSAKDVTVENGTLRLVLHEQQGTFSLYRFNPIKADYVPLIESVEDSATSGFYLKAETRAGSFFRKLERSYGTTITAVQNEDGSAQLVYDVDGLYEVTARFAFVAPVQDKPQDSFCLTLTVANKNEINAVCGLKAMFDTLLGEPDRTHFTTAKGVPIQSEKAYLTMVSDKWISSSDGTDTVSFLLAGTKVTAPDYVILASRDLLLADMWKIPENEGRSFSTVQCPNNSALAVYWKEATLRPSESASYTIYITTATDGEVPPDAPLLGITQTASVRKDDESLTAGLVQNNEPIIVTVGQEAVDPEYVRQLLARIEALEASGAEDSEEIQRLNDELDSVILRLTR